MKPIITHKIFGQTFDKSILPAKAIHNQEAFIQDLLEDQLIKLVTPRRLISILKDMKENSNIFLERGLCEVFNTYLNAQEDLSRTPAQVRSAFIRLFKPPTDSAMSPYWFRLNADNVSKRTMIVYFKLSSILYIEKRRKEEEESLPPEEKQIEYILQNRSCIFCGSYLQEKTTTYEDSSHTESFSFYCGLEVRFHKPEVGNYSMEVEHTCENQEESMRRILYLMENGGNNAED